jgi:hypothetical protein
MLSTKYVTSEVAAMMIVVAFSAIARADDLTGLSQDDPKDLYAAQPAPCQPSGALLFVPMPSWARGVVMPPLPDQLRPMGKKPVVAAARTPSPVEVPKPPSTPALTTTDTVPKDKPAPIADNPTLMAVSPFLQWIKSNPQAAALQARQQANSYRQPTPAGTVPNSAGSSNPGSTGTGGDPYWLPPLIDSGDFGSKTVTGGSAAIYSTPQR